MGLPTDTNGDGTISNMAIVSHIDDDLLFMNPDIRNSIRSGGAHTTVYVTAGDAGNNAAYWQGREAGAKAAYRVDNASEVDPAWLAGVASVGVTTAGLAGIVFVATQYASGAAWSVALAGLM